MYVCIDTNHLRFTSNVFRWKPEDATLLGQAVGGAHHLGALIAPEAWISRLPPGHFCGAETKASKTSERHEGHITLIPRLLDLRRIDQRFPQCWPPHSFA